MAATQLIAEAFRQRFGNGPDVIASAPGRVNLIGEHTDYNDGFVFPMAIHRRVQIAMGRRSDDSYDVESTVSSNGAPYVLAMASAMRQQHGGIPGANVLIAGDLPVGAGLSSSAALELAVARGLASLGDVAWDPVKTALLAQSVENDSIGVQCGIMDQAAAASGRRGHAMLLDCRSLHMSYVQVPDDVSIVVMDTGMRRALATSEFNERRAECQTAVAAIRAVSRDVRALRDVTPEMLDALESSLDSVTLRRTRHVVHENLRPMALSRALAARDFAAAGQLMDASHCSLRDLYEVSGVHLDIICETARAHPACYGARMTGAGFGGCAIALVATDSVETFIADTKPRYEARTYKRSDFFPVTADDGARLEPTRRQ